MFQRSKNGVVRSLPFMTMTMMMMVVSFSAMTASAFITVVPSSRAVVFQVRLVPQVVSLKHSIKNKPSLSVLYAESQDDDNNKDDEIINKDDSTTSLSSSSSFSNTDTTTPLSPSSFSSSSSSSKSPAFDDSTSTKSLWTRLDELGQDCKKKGSLFRLKSQTKSLTTSKQIQYVAQACGYYALFILYRAYRGCFVILPAVFREVSRKLERAVELEDDLDDDNDNDATLGENNGGNKAVLALDINPETGKIRWRTRITVAILASIVTLSYMLGGALRVVQSFGQTVTRTASVTTGFEAAADQVIRNEDQIVQRINKAYDKFQQQQQQQQMKDRVNGQQPYPDTGGLSSGLAP